MHLVGVGSGGVSRSMLTHNFHQPPLPVLLARFQHTHSTVSQVEALEHDKHVVTDAFDRVVKEMQADLQEVSSR